LILAIYQRTIRHTGYLQLERAFLTCSTEGTPAYILGIRYQAFAPPRRLEDTSEEFTGSQIGIKKGVWGESRLDFESIVEEVRRFVAGMPLADSTTGLACYPLSFSALGDQRAEILPVPRPPALAVGGRCMMRLRFRTSEFLSFRVLAAAAIIPTLPSSLAGLSSHRCGQILVRFIDRLVTFRMKAIAWM